MPDIIQVAEQLKDMPDQWLAQQMQQPSGTAPPWLVASEVARRQRMRSGATKAQAPQSSVSQDLINSLFARIPPTAGLMPQTQGAPTPPGMPPVNLSPGSNPSTLGAAPGGTPPGNFKMPARMAAGGQFDDSDDDQPDGAPDVYSMPLQNPSRRAQLDQLMMPPVQEAPAQPQPTTMPQQAAPVAPPPAMPSGPVGSADRMAPDAGAAGLAGWQVKDLVQEASERYKVPQELITAVMGRESSGNPNAVSPKGAIGLMQVMPKTAGDYGVTDPAELLDPARNIDVGTRHLKKMLDLFHGDVPTALAAYNEGQGNVMKQQRAGKPYFNETQNYVKNINADLNAQRAKLNLAPAPDVSPSVLQSRLLQERQPVADNAPAPPTPDATATAATPPAATTTDTAATPAPNAPGPPTPIIAPAIERPAELRELDAQYQRASEDLAKTLASVTPYDPRTTTTQQAIQGYKDRIRTFIGPEPDNSKFQQSFQDLTAMAQKLLHPTIGNMLMNWGLHLMASKQHNFGVALGEAGLAAQADYEQKQAQGRGLWIQALDLGMKLQDRTNNYNEKIGQLAMQEQRLDQSAGTALYTQQFNLAKEKRVELQNIARDRAKLQGELDKKFEASPAGRLAQLNQFRQTIGQPAITTQNISDSEKLYYEYGTKPSATTGKDTETSLAMKAAGGDAQAQKALQILGKGDTGFDAYLNPQAAGQPARPGPVATPPAAAGAPAAQTPAAAPVEVPPVRGTPTLGYSSTGRNENLLSNLPPEEAAIIRGLADYKIALPSRQSLSKPQWQHRMQAALLYDPNFNQATYEQRAKLQNAFTGGKEATQINALNTLIGHAQRLQTNWTRLNNYGGLRTPLNAPINWLLEAKGDPRIQPAIMDMQAVPEEMMRLWRTAGGSDKDLAGWQRAMGLNLSPASQADVIKEVLGLAEGKLRGLRNQYETGMGRPADFHFLTPESAKFFEQYGLEHRDVDPGYAVRPGGAGGGAPAPSGGGSTVMLGGREIVPRGGRWVYKDSGQAVQ